MLQVAKPVESIKQCKCGWKDNSWDFVNLRDRIKSFFGIVHGTSDASFALTFVCSILIPVFIIVVFSIVPFPTFGPVHHNASFWRVIWRLARRCSANIQFRIQQKKSKVWLTLPYVFLKAFKKCRRGERKRNRGNPFAIVAAAASLSILYVNKCIITHCFISTFFVQKIDFWKKIVKINWFEFLNPILRLKYSRQFYISHNVENVTKKSRYLFLNFPAKTFKNNRNWDILNWFSNTMHLANSHWSKKSFFGEYTNDTFDYKTIHQVATPFRCNAWTITQMSPFY